MSAICEQHLPVLKKFAPISWRQQLDQTCGRKQSARIRRY